MWLGNKVNGNVPTQAQPMDIVAEGDKEDIFSVNDMRDSLMGDG
jgi:hypothetical protein